MNIIDKVFTWNKKKDLAHTPSESEVIKALDFIKSTHYRGVYHKIKEDGVKSFYIIFKHPIDKKINIFRVGDDSDGVDEATCSNLISETIGKTIDWERENVLTDIDIRFDIIDKVFTWNKERGLLAKGYKKELEASFVAEELSELLRGIDLADAVDAHIDSIIFQLGALSKILKSPQAVESCFNAVLLANDQKGKALDKDGKVLKDKSVFVEPQDVINKILDEVYGG